MRAPRPRCVPTPGQLGVGVGVGVTWIMSRFMRFPDSEDRFRKNQRHQQDSQFSGDVVSSQHKRPFLAFVVLVVIAAAVVGANAFRANAERARFIAAGPIAADSSVVHGVIPLPGPGAVASAAEQHTGPDDDTVGPTDGSGADTSTGSADASSDRAHPSRGTAKQRAAAHPMAAMIFDAAVPEDREVPAVPAPAGHVDPTVRDSARDDDRHPARSDEAGHRSHDDRRWHRSKDDRSRHRSEDDRSRHRSESDRRWHRPQDGRGWHHNDATDRPSMHQGPDQSRAEHVRGLLAGVLDGRRPGGPSLRSRSSR